MKEYKVLAKRVEYYTFDIAADTEQAAIDEVRHIENFGDLASYLETFDGMEILSVEEVSE